MHDASVAQLLCHFSFQLAPRMGGPEGVDRQEINRLTLQPGAGWLADSHSYRRPWIDHNLVKMCKADTMHAQKSDSSWHVR